MGKLLVVLVILGVFVAFKVGDYVTTAALRNVDDGIVLGQKASLAVADYYLAKGKYPQTLAELPEKIEATPMAELALTSQAGEVAITLRNKNISSIAGQRMFFRPNISGKKVAGVSCRAEDKEFRELVKDRCGEG